MSNQVLPIGVLKNYYMHFRMINCEFCRVKLKLLVN